MPMAMHLLNSLQPVRGMDLHEQIPPPPPAGPVPQPHIISAVLGQAMIATSKISPTVMAGGGFAIGRQHDLGIGMYHFAPNALLPLVWLAGGNKCEFGVASVMIPVRTPAGSTTTERLAVACLPPGGNLQLDCNEPIAFPSSMADAALNTVYAGFSLADAIAGVVAMAVDIAWIAAVNEVVGWAKDVAIVEALLLVSDSAGLFVVGAAATLLPTTATFVSEATSVLLGWVIGSPLGYSIDWWPAQQGGNANVWITRTISPTPTLPEPTSGGAAPTPAASPALPPPASPAPSAAPNTTPSQPAATDDPRWCPSPSDSSDPTQSAPEEPLQPTASDVAPDSGSTPSSPMTPDPSAAPSQTPVDAQPVVGAPPPSDVGPPPPPMWGPNPSPATSNASTPSAPSSSEVPNSSQEPWSDPKGNRGSN